MGPRRWATLLTGADWPKLELELGWEGGKGARGGAEERMGRERRIEKKVEKRVEE